MDLTAHHIGLVVSDLARSRAFYECLGFAVESSLELDDGARSLTFMRLGDFRIELFWYAQTPPLLSGAEDGHVGFRHFALKTDDIDETVAELKRLALAPRDAEIREVAGRYRLIFISDPDGTEIEISQEL